MGYSYGHGYGHTWKGKRRRGTAGTPSAVGGGALLEGEVNGFATDFLYATDAQRVAVKATNVITNYALNAFYANAGTSPKMVWRAELPPHNLLKWSSDFTNAYWFIFNYTVVANANTAPNGMLEADKIYGNLAGGYLSGTLDPPSTEVMTFSVYAKAGEVSYILMEDFEGETADGFNLSTGTLFNDPGIPTTGSPVMEAVGSGWYCCSIKLKVGSTYPTIYLLNGPTTGDDDVPADQGVYLWGAQVNYGTAPTTYVPTTAAIVNAGWLGWSPHNMILQSQTLEQTTPWNPTTVVTVTVNATTAPDATTTADKVAETAAAGSNHQLLHANITTMVAGETYTLSVYAKAAERSWITLCMSNSDVLADWFDLTNGVMGTTANGGVITSVGNGWYRCSITKAVSSSSNNPALHIRTSNGQVGAYTGTVGSGVYLWGAQLNRGTTPQPYLPTTTAARYGLAIDYDPVTHAPKGLLCEPAATNLVLQNTRFESGAGTWSYVSSSVTANTTIAPDGTQTADTYTATANLNSALFTTSVITAVAATYTHSLYVKAGTATWITLELWSGSATSGVHLWFNVQTGVLGTGNATTTGTYVSKAVTALPNGWYRIEVTGIWPASNLFFAMRIVDGDGAYNFTAVSGLTFYLWGAQSEVGTVATSPIPTFAASATRAADGYNVTPASINHSATAGSWWAEVEVRATNTGRFIGYSAAAASPMYVNLNSFNIFDSTILSKPVTSGLGIHKVASAFQASDRALTADGLAVVSDTGVATNLLVPGTIHFNGPTTPANGWIRKHYYLPRRMPNAELVTETT